MKKFIINTTKDLKKIKIAIDYSKKYNESIGILLKRTLWRDKK
jgi:hypothetical protein